MQSDYTLVYVYGAGHCGSTLLNLLLNGHSDVTGLSEVDSLAESATGTDPFGRDFFEDPFWQSIEECFQRRTERSLEQISVAYPPLRQLMQWSEERIRDWNRDNRILFECVASRAGTPIVVDSSKWYQRLHLLRYCEKHDLRVIHLVRDGRAILNSYVRKYGSFLQGFRRWFVSSFLSLYYERTVPDDRWIRVKYENLARNTESVLQQLCDFLNLSYQPRMLGYRNHDYHGIGGNRMVLDDSESIELDTQWEDELSLKDRVLFGAIGGWLNSLLGY